MSFDNVNGGDQYSVTVLCCNSWVSKWGGPTVDVTILKEIYYRTYLPNDINCTGNDITVCCSGLWKHSTPLHSPHWTSTESCLVTGRVNVVYPLQPLPNTPTIVPSCNVIWPTMGPISVMFQNIK